MASWESPIIWPMKYSPSVPKSSSDKSVQAACFARNFSQTILPSASSRAVWPSEIVPVSPIIPLAKTMLLAKSVNIIMLIALKIFFFILLKNQNLIRTFYHFEQVGHRGNRTHFAFFFAAYFQASAASVNFAFQFFEFRYFH